MRPSGEDSTITEWIPPIIDKNSDFPENLHVGIDINSDFIDIDFTEKLASTETKVDSNIIKNRDHGYDDGYKIGKYEAESIIQADIKESLSLLQSNIDKFTAPLNNIDENVQKELAELAILIAEKMIVDHIRHKPETIINLVSEAIKLLPNKNKTLTISINPEDLEFIEGNIDSIEEFNCKFIEDSQLQRGGMLIQSDDINVDLSLEKRMHDLIEQFFDGS